MSRVFEALRNAAPPNVIAFRAGMRSAPELAALIEQPTLAPLHYTSVIADPTPESRLVSLRPSNSGAERFRVLADRLAHRQKITGLKIVVVTSAMPGEGKSFVASNLAITLAKECKRKTVLLEGDLCKPVLSTMFGLTADSGLNGLLCGPDARNASTYYLDNIGLHLLPATHSIDDSFRLLQSPALAQLLESLRSSFDWIVIDAPPLASPAEANVWCRTADGVLLVVNQGKTTKKAIQTGLHSLDDPKLIGVVLNDAGRPQNLRKYPS